MVDFIRHLLVPHHTNNHRARVLHIDAFFVYIVLLAMFNFGVRMLHREYPTVLGYATDIQVEQLFTQTNAKRQEANLAPLVLNAQLSQAAAGKAQDMFAQGYWSHTSSNGKTPWDFIVGAGYRYTAAGENLAKNFSHSGAVIDAWMASQTHRDNILKPNYRDIGFAVVNGVLSGEETTLVVQMFGTSTTRVAALPREQNLVREVSAQETSQLPAGTLLVPTEAPQVTPGARASARSLAISKVASMADQNNQPAAFTGPLVDIPTATRSVAYAIAGLLLGVLVLDAWLVHSRRIVRVSGHTVAHFLFLVAILIGMSTILRGSVL